MKKYRVLLSSFLIVVSLHTTAQSIYRTACQGNLTRLDSLLADTSINTFDERGRSLLHWAVACKEKEVFDFLIDKKIEINSEDQQGVTPLHMTIRFNTPIFFNRLLDLQKDKKWTAKYGASLLERSILKENFEFVKELIERGVDVNIVNNRGSTPLEIALRIKAKEISEWLISKGADQTKVRTIQLTGEYLGQEKPGLTPQIFAPNFISTEESEFGSIFNRKATEFYYGVDVNGKAETRYSKRIGNLWSNPETVLSHERYGYNDPFLSPDENRLYFISERALDGLGDLKDHDIWYVEKKKDGWSEPINAGPNINSSGNEYYISFTNDGTMYFSSNVNAPTERKRSDLDIYYSKFVNGEFQKAVSLGDSINTPNYEADVFVAPDESYVIFCSIRPEGLGRGDLYISFKKPDGTWTKSVNMGEKINTQNHELCPFVTLDGKYFFYTSNQDIYWVDAKIINDFRK
ncbi:ankyrin repeat domain-containing protein [Aquimarina sp. 2201CG5-10]|uniref:ankyrin repeat domain-containing protein n=1 Tax=Aquimarina callyspongiae TaxID=3098150 RepID=UPI002AB40216|nr:ankyrin repeat domain-containing protein [Aquimarina sp. 2201CG5-10]MDY8134268.1 ankyrin repeat domain-containing protein [Aquimarina sp. 2201CG5-10]